MGRLVDLMVEELQRMINDALPGNLLYKRPPINQKEICLI